MNLDSEKLQILADIDSFSNIQRYRGMMPSRLAMFHDDEQLTELINNEYVERVLVDLPCGSETKLLKLTDLGAELLDEARVSGSFTEPGPQRPQLEIELSKRQWILLKDIYHFSGIHRHRGMMPLSELEAYDQEDVRALYANGLIIRVKIESGGKKIKGMALSRKGLRLIGLLI